MNDVHQMILPKNSVRRIMKVNDEVSAVSQDSVAIAGKAAEYFISELAEAAKNEAIANNRKTIKVEDILNVIDSNQMKYEFLNDAFSTPKSK